jgi:hypothetical protein
VGRSVNKSTIAPSVQPPGYCIKPERRSSAAALAGARVCPWLSCRPCSIESIVEVVCEVCCSKLISVQIQRGGPRYRPLATGEPFKNGPIELPLFPCFGASRVSFCAAAELWRVITGVPLIQLDLDHDQNLRRLPLALGAPTSPPPSARWLSAAAVAAAAAAAAVRARCD